jgi:hypothetical protein
MTYTDHDGAKRVVRGCTMSVDHLDRYWIWNEQVKHNLVYRIKGKENALLAAIDMLQSIIRARDERITELQRIVDLAIEFADQIKPDNVEDN